MVREIEYFVSDPGKHGIQFEVGTDKITLEFCMIVVDGKIEESVREFAYDKLFNEIDTLGIKYEDLIPIPLPPWSTSDD